MKNLLITGGSGFLGRELGRQLKNKYRVFLASRNNEKNRDATRLTGCESLPLDVTSLSSVRDVFSECSPSVVIHAAATKYVDLSEKFPNECIDVNVVGSQNIARASCDFSVERVIGISTDKAAPPTKSTYGISKAMMERLFCGMDGKTATKFATVRFGNIAWSTGSVFPLWTQMLKDTGSIETTGPHMRRFFFSVDQAAQLVVECLDEIEITRGRILTRQMKVAQIQNLLDLFVERYGGDYKRVAVRPGESVDETLVGSSELAFTQIIEINGQSNYLIDFKKLTTNPIPNVVDSLTSLPMSKEEMWNLLTPKMEN